MAESRYPTAPIPTDRMPPGIPYIIGNEAAERFSYYGMRTILVIFMTKHLLDRQGNLAAMGEEEAKYYYHLFTSSVYFFPILGAILADALWGKYRTIVTLSLVYCLGHVALALDETRLGLFVGLLLIAVGAGGIKSCVSAHVGDQFGSRNRRLLEKVFAWFYFSINLGAAASSVSTPWLLATYGAGVAFAVPGVLMALATLVFFMGRSKFAHIPPGGSGFLKETTSGEGLRAVVNLSLIYVFVAVFWSLFDQSGSAWVLQAQDMDRRWFGVNWTPSQIQAVNPLLIMFMIPLFAYGVYPLINRVFRLTPLRKISIGMFVGAAAFAVSAWIEHMIVDGGRPHIVWQVLAYVILTAAEIMVSITCLEFSYTQAPKKMKSLVMGLFLLSISLGNVFTAAVNFFIQNDDKTSKLPGASYYWFFTALMLATALLFVGVAAAYRGRTYIQDNE